MAAMVWDSCGRGLVQRHALMSTLTVLLAVNADTDSTLQRCAVNKDCTETPGEFCVPIGLVCHTTPKGAAPISGGISMQWCQPGTYAPLPRNNPECLACPGGKYQEKAEQTECDCIPAGQRAVDSVILEPCPIGTYYPGDCNESAGCLECDPGRFAPSTGAAKCECSKPGYGSTETGDAEEECPADQYSEECDACKECPAGSTSEPGSTVCEVIDTTGTTSTATGRLRSTTATTTGVSQKIPAETTSETSTSATGVSQKIPAETTSETSTSATGDWGDIAIVIADSAVQAGGGGGGGGAPTPAPSCGCAEDRGLIDVVWMVVILGCLVLFGLTYAMCKCAPGLMPSPTVDESAECKPLLVGADVNVQDPPRQGAGLGKEIEENTCTSILVRLLLGKENQKLRKATASTTLLSAVSAGDTTLPVASTVGLSVGCTVEIEGGGNSETGVVASIGPLVLTGGLTNSYPASTTTVTFATADAVINELRQQLRNKDKVIEAKDVEIRILKRQLEMKISQVAKLPADPDDLRQNMSEDRKRVHHGDSALGQTDEADKLPSEVQDYVTGERDMLIKSLADDEHQLKLAGGDENKREVIEYRRQKNDALLACLPYEAARIAKEKGAAFEFCLHDALTLLKSKTCLGQLLERTRESSGCYCLWAVADLDNFKVINDVWSHAHGDLAIIEACKCVQDVVARWNECQDQQRTHFRADSMRYGGDEIVLIITMPLASKDKGPPKDVKDLLEDVYHGVCKKLQERFSFKELADTPKWQDKPWIKFPGPAMSIGVSPLLPCDSSIQDVYLKGFKRADDLLNDWKKKWKKGEEDWKGKLGGGIIFADDLLNRMVGDAAKALKVLQKNDATPEAQEKAAREIHKVACDAYDKKEIATQEIATQGDRLTTLKILVMVVIMDATEPGGHTSVAVENVVGALGALAVEPDNKQEIAADQNALNALAKLLSADAEPGCLQGLAWLRGQRTPSVQEQAARVLWALAVGDADNQKKIADTSGALQGLTGLLGQGSPGAKEQAASVLWALAENDNNKKRIAAADLGALQGLAGLLGAGSPGAQEQAAGLLRNLTAPVDRRSAAGGARSSK